MPAQQLSLFDERFVRLGGRLVEYRFERRSRRTLGITIDAHGMTVAAPLRAPFRDIESFLRDKERWILRKLDEWGRVPKPRVLGGYSGEQLPFFGTPHVLDIGTGRRLVSREGDRILVRVPEYGRVLEALLAWLKARALDALLPRTAHFVELLGVGMPRVGLSAARKQWGVCLEGGHIRLNWRLVHLAPELSDYVIAHEVAHLVEMNHSRRFWNVLASIYPAWREARERLELAGAALPVIRPTRAARTAPERDSPA